MMYRSSAFARLSWLCAAMSMSIIACGADSSDAAAAGHSGRASSGGSGGEASSTGGASAAGGRGGQGSNTGGKTGSGGKAANGGSAAAASGGSGASTSSGNGSGETGRLVGMTDAHNAVRARIMHPAPDPALPPMKWSTDVAKVAQAYADKLAKDTMCQSLVHSMNPSYGENLAEYGGLMATPEDVVDGWAAEEECTTYGPITSNGSECDVSCAEKKYSNGCGHYTQVVWRNSTELGCGVASCGSGRQASEVWVCNYRPAGNIIGQKPY